LEFPRRVNSQPGIGIVGGLSRFDYDTRIALNPYYSLLSNYYTSVNIEIAKYLLMGTDSLICAKASLMGRLNSLLGRNKFPAPMRRELARKHLTLLPYSAYPLVVLWPIRPKFPANSQLAGNFGLSETGSLMTVSSSGESANFGSDVVLPSMPDPLHEFAGTLVMRCVDHLRRAALLNDPAGIHELDEITGFFVAAMWYGVVGPVGGNGGVCAAVPGWWGHTTPIGGVAAGGTP
jgi:hypothetical protein